MSASAITYDLVLLLDPSADDAVKQRVLSYARSTIEDNGEMIRNDEWGLRPLAYEIDHKSEAEYHLIQFHVREAAALAELDRTLRITDGVLRFMIAKLRHGTPDPPQPGARTARPVEAEASPAAA